MSWSENVVGASPIVGVEWARGKGLPRRSVGGRRCNVFDLKDTGMEFESGVGVWEQMEQEGSK